MHKKAHHYQQDLQLFISCCALFLFVRQGRAAQPVQDEPGRRSRSVWCPLQAGEDQGLSGAGHGNIKQTALLLQLGN